MTQNYPIEYATQLGSKQSFLRGNFDLITKLWFPESWSILNRLHLTMKISVCVFVYECIYIVYKLQIEGPLIYGSILQKQIIA